MMADILTVMVETGVPFLERLATVEDVAQRLANEPDHRRDPHTAEALAYSLILNGEYDRALRELALLRRITLEDEEAAEWWKELDVLPAGVDRSGRGFL
jgi:thioredoxin-like negative regulator of GroEL